MQVTAGHALTPPIGLTLLIESPEALDRGVEAEGRREAFRSRINRSDLKQGRVWHGS
jgi:hypothetical protein